MSKHINRILIGCLLCVVIIFILFLIAFRFNFNSCELISMEPQSQRNATLVSWANSRPLRTKDKSTLLKISAYLEYNMRTEKDEKRDRKLRREFQPGAGAAPTPLPVGAGGALPQTGVGANEISKHPTPIVPVTGLSSAQLQNSSYQHRANTTLGGATIAPLTNYLLTNGDDPKERRFLPLELSEIEMRKQDETRFKYTLTFNCSTLIMVLRREPTRVSVEKMSVELRVENRKKSKCEVDFNGRPSVFVTEIQQPGNWARYYCDRELRFNCTHYGKNPKQAGTLLGQLVIDAIEFETGGNSSPPTHQNHHFQGTPKQCGPSDI